MFDLSFKDSDAVVIEKVENTLSVIPKRDAFNKTRLRKGVTDRDDLISEDIDRVGIPYLVNQVCAYALAFSKAQGVEYVTLSLCLSIAEELGIDMKETVFNKKTFRSQLKAQIAKDRNLLPVQIAFAPKVKSTVKREVKGKMTEVIVTQEAEKAEKLFQGYMPASSEIALKFEQCITYC